MERNQQRKNLRKKITNISTSLIVASSIAGHSNSLEAKSYEGETRINVIKSKIDFKYNNGRISYDKIYASIYGSNKLKEAKCVSAEMANLPIGNHKLKEKVCVLDISNLVENETKREFHFTIYTGIERDKHKINGEKVEFERKMIIMKAFYDDNCVSLLGVKVPKKESFDLSKTRLTGYAFVNVKNNTEKEGQRCMNKYGIFFRERMQEALENALDTFNSRSD
jgi:hypothetical protein